jgi:hypothetical protein
VRLAYPGIIRADKGPSPEELLILKKDSIPAPEGRLSVPLSTSVIFCRVFGKSVGKAPSIALAANDVADAIIPRSINMI